MKKTVRLLTLAMALMLALSLCLPVLAENTLTAAAAPVKVTLRAVREGYTKKIAKDIVIEALPGAPIVFTPRSVKGYTFSQIVNPATNAAVDLATYTAPATDAMLYASYLKNQKLTIKYVYKAGSKLKNATKATTMTLSPGQSYTVTPKEIKGYTFLEIDDPNKGVAPKTGSTVTVYYGKNVTATVKFVLDGKKKKSLAASQKLSGLSGQAYDVNSVLPALTGYQVSSVSDPNKGVFGTKNHTITVKYTAVTGASATTPVTPAVPADKYGKTIIVTGYIISAETGAVLGTSTGYAAVGVPTALPVPTLDGLMVEKITINGADLPTSSSTYTPVGDTDIIWYVRSTASKIDTNNIGFDRTDYPQVETSSDAAYLLEAINAQRAYAGLPALTIDKTLNWCASVRAQESAISYEHTRPDGRSCFTVHPLLKGENLGRINGVGNAATDYLMQLWMASTTHRANILSSNFKTVGLYVYYASDGNTYWAQAFGY
ncbi:MAG: MucBP domain-containing protein [Eubacteriales bacterium]|nr:MucBP domain-containing protein [Eubacteriales bacterium]